MCVHLNTAPSSCALFTAYFTHYMTHRFPFRAFSALLPVVSHSSNHENCSHQLCTLFFLALLDAKDKPQWHLNVFFLRCWVCHAVTKGYQKLLDAKDKPQWHLNVFFLRCWVCHAVTKGYQKLMRDCLQNSYLQIL